MRYKDVIDRVADDKDLRAHQTPIFVVQAEFTEKFGRLPPNVAETMTAAAASVRGEASKRRALVDIVREQSATYAEEDAVRKHLEALPDEILALGADGAATELFELTTQLIADFRTSLVPDRSGIAAWLHEHRDEEYFVTIKLEQYRETPGGPLEVAPLGFSSTVELPFKGLLVALEPKFANLRKYYVVVIPVVSPTSIRLFYCLGQFRRVSWTEFRATPAQEWKTHAVVPNDKDATGSMATVVLAELLVAADDDLSKRFGKGMVDDDEDGDGEG